MTVVRGFYGLGQLWRPRPYIIEVGGRGQITDKIIILHGDWVLFTALDLNGFQRLSALLLHRHLSCGFLQYMCRSLNGRDLGLPICSDMSLVHATLMVIKCSEFYIYKSKDGVVVLAV